MVQYMIRRHSRKPAFKEVCGHNRLSYGNPMSFNQPVTDDGDIVYECVDSEDFYEDEEWERKGFESD